MKVLVTGATGYLGAHVAARLASAGHTVLALVRTGKENRLPSGCRPVAGDVLDPVSIERALSGCDALVHMAALVKMWVRDRRQFDRGDNREYGLYVIISAILLVLGVFGAFDFAGLQSQQLAGVTRAHGVSPPTCRGTRR